MSDPKDHNPHVAEIYRAMALRFYIRYLDARRYTDHHGDDLQGYGPLPTEREADDRYQAEADGCLIESADSADAALALVRFAGVIAADRLIGEAMQEPVNDERDAYHQAVALANAAGWINKIAIDAGAAAQLRLLRQWGRDYEWNEPLEELADKLLAGLERIGEEARP